MYFIFLCVYLFVCVVVAECVELQNSSVLMVSEIKSDAGMYQRCAGIQRGFKSPADPSKRCMHHLLHPNPGSSHGPRANMDTLCFKSVDVYSDA